MRRRAIAIWILVLLSLGFAAGSTLRGSTLRGSTLSDVLQNNVLQDDVPWCHTAPISWDHFRGVPPPDAHARSKAAAIHMTVRWSLSFIVEYNQRSRRWNGYVEEASLVVTNTMQPSLSWVIPGKDSAAVLNHEQRHFDLNEIYRRKLLAGLSRVRGDGGSSEEVRTALNRAIAATAEQILNALAEAQALYDVETAHGTNPTMQAIWDERIDTWLADSNPQELLPAQGLLYLETDVPTPKTRKVPSDQALLVLRVALCPLILLCSVLDAVMSEAYNVLL